MRVGCEMSDGKLKSENIKRKRNVINKKLL